MRYIHSVLFLVVFVLAGCGGGSGGAPATEPDAPVESAQMGEEGSQPDPTDTSESEMDAGATPPDTSEPLAPVTSDQPNQPDASDQDASASDGGSTDTANEEVSDSSNDMMNDNIPMDGIQLVLADDFSALEGSTVEIAAEIAGFDPATMELTLTSITQSDDTVANTRGEIETSVSPLQFQIELPLVDVDTVLDYQIRVRYQDNELSDTGLLTDSISITVQDGLPSEAIVVSAVGREPAGILGATLSDIDLTALSANGIVGFSGSYRDESDVQGEGLWMGPADAMQLVLKTGDAVNGLPDNARFERALSLSLSPDGELGAVIELSGAGTTRAGIITVDGLPMSILRAGDSIGIPEISTPIPSLSQVIRTNEGAYVESTVEDVFLWQAGNFTVVSAGDTVEEAIASAPTIADIANLPIGLTEDKCFVRRNGPLFVSQTGDVSFSGLARPLSEFRPLAFLTGDSDDGFCERDPIGVASVLQFRDGAITEIVRIPDDVSGPFQTFSIIDFPGIADAGYSVEEVLHTFDNGEVLFVTNVSQPATLTQILPVDQTAIVSAANPATASLSLIAMTGESVPPDFVTAFENLTQSFVTANAVGQVAIVTEQNGELAIFSGIGHAGQPHTSLLSPGSAALGFITGQNAVAPAGFSSSTFFASISNPVLDNTGMVRYLAKLEDAADPDFELEAFWVSTQTGDTEIRTSTYAPVQFGGRQLRLISADVPLSEFRPPSSTVSDGQIVSDNAGNILFRGSLDDTNFNNSSRALLVLPAN